MTKATPSPASILGLGEWIPEVVRTNDAWPADFGARAAESENRWLVEVQAGRTGDAIDRIVARHVASEAGDPFVGSTRRRIADAKMTSVEAEVLAGRAALADAGVDAKEVDLVLSWAVVPDHVTPASAPRVAHAIGATRAFGSGVDAGCASAIAQLAFAAAMIESGRARYALLTQSHLMTRAFPMGHPASPNVGDAATAILVGPSARPGILETHAVSHGEYYDAVLWRRREGDDTSWHEAGGATYLGSRDREAARKLIQDTVRIAAQTVRELVDRAGIGITDLAAIASVQPRRWIPGAIAEALGLPTSIAPQTFDELAHLGGTGVVTNLIAARRAGLLSPGALVALYGQGAGFVRSAALLRWERPTP